MNIYENVATQAITSFFYNETLWKKKILFDFLLKPFGLKFEDIENVLTQDHLGETIPDFTIITHSKNIRFEVKINDADLTPSEQKNNTRDAYLIRKNYFYIGKIPKSIPKDKILFWEDFFELIDKWGATKEFARLDLIREYMKTPYYSLLLTPHEVAMFYSPETISAVFSMSEKILKLCENFLLLHENIYALVSEEKDSAGIGYYFSEKTGMQRNFFIGLDLTLSHDIFTISLQTSTNQYDEYHPLDREILTKFDSDEKMQEEFNKNIMQVLESIK